MARKRKQFSCDFETTTKIDDCRVWAYGWMEIGNKKNMKIGNDLVEFMDWCEKIKADLYFHNLKFDGEFIVNWLLKNGYKHNETGLAKTFHATISGMGQWYIIDICYGYSGKDKLHTTIYDSRKKLPFSVKKIAQDFKLNVLKGDIDYHAERPIGHVITDEEYKYINNDIEIIAEALHIQFSQGLTKMTNGSDSLTGFKSVISKKVFDKLFPVFSFELDDNLRKSYKGGFTWLNSKYASVDIYDGLVFDVNSLYPSQMMDRYLPHGTPVFFEGEYVFDEVYPLYIQHIKCEFELKEGYIPTIQIKGNGMFMPNEYLKDSKGEIVDLWVTNIDLELMNEHYELDDVQYLTGWKFKQMKGIFTKFIEKWMYIKTTSDGAIKLLAKLMLNSLYGKLGSNPNVTGKYPILKEDGSCRYVFALDENGNKIEEIKDPIYLPQASFITAWARYTTITTAQKCYDRIIYCDTDSIHLVGTEIPDAIKDLIDDDKLGYWQHESTFKRARYLRQKTYVQEIYSKDIEKNGQLKTVGCGKEEATKIKLKVTCSGMNDNVKKNVTFDNFRIGFKSFGSLNPKHVSGGIVLVDSEFTIK